ncbi:MAG: GTPase Era [candidate division WOR-3 bacterium]|nr:MAG: GTPase Era [candidate division WOR-3 bacterium]
MKAGYVAIIGRPNVGKSTLLNSLLGTKISAVTAKPQTTRSRILGILTENECQICFIDTPGIISPGYELQEQMVKQIKIAVEDSDLLLLMIEPWFREDRTFDEFIQIAGDAPVVIVINKIDLIEKTDLLPLIERLGKGRFADVVPVSALKGTGIEELKRVIFTHIPDGEFYFHPEQLSDAPERFFAADLIREKIFETFKEEVPYATCVVIDEFKEREKSKDYIRATVYVERPSQKAILIGKHGAALKVVGERARQEIEKFLGRSVYLELWVKVKKKWRKNKRFLKELGY